MSERREDRELRELFSQVRDGDRQRAPSFESVWNRASRLANGPDPRRPPGLRPGWAVVGFVGVVALAVAVAWIAPWDSPPSLDEEIALAQEMSTWEAPTDVLLRLSSLEVPSTVPSLEVTSIPLPEVPATSPTNGDC